MITGYVKEEYHQAFMALLTFVKNNGLQYIIDRDDREECSAAVDWIIESGVKGTAFGLVTKYLKSAIKEKKTECVKILQNSDLNSKNYRDVFSTTFMAIINDLTFVPDERKEQIRRVIHGEKGVEDEKECIRLLQNLLYSILPKYFKISSTEMRAFVASLDV